MQSGFDAACADLLRTVLAVAFCDVLKICRLAPTKVTTLAVAVVGSVDREAANERRGNDIRSRCRPSAFDARALPATLMTAMPARRCSRQHVIQSAGRA